MNPGTGEGVVGGAGLAGKAKTVARRRGPPRRGGAISPTRRRKGGEDDSPKGSTVREPAGKKRTIGSASERPLGRSSRTAYEWLRVGLRVSEKADGAKRSIALERRRWL